MKNILITGGNAGIGKATATALAKQGNKIILACRDEQKADAAIKEIRKASGNQEVHNVVCDLSSLASVHTCSETYRAQFGKLDILINNAGVATDKLQFTKDGFELHMGVNHFGHFLLTTSLIDLIQEPKEGRVVNVSSDAHYRGKINFDTFRGEIGIDRYKGMPSYGQSKLANVLFTKELARRYPSIMSHSLHPGVVGTNIAKKNDNGRIWKMMWGLFKPLMLSPEKGTLTSIYLASADEPLKMNGKYFSKRKEKAPSDIANDEALALKLWEVSEELVSRP